MGGVGTALLGPSPDGTCKAVLCVVTADGAILQEHTVKGLDGLAPPGTVRPLLGRWWDRPSDHIAPRFGVVMNPYAETPVVRQLFVTEPFHDTIAVIDLVIYGAAPNQVFALAQGRIRRIRSLALNQPVDLAPVEIDADNINWASNTSLDDGSDFYVANRGDNTIVRMRQDRTVVAIRPVETDGDLFDDVRLNGIASIREHSKIYLTFTGSEDLREESSRCRPSDRDSVAGNRRTITPRGIEGCRIGRILNREAAGRAPKRLIFRSRGFLTIRVLANLVHIMAFAPDRAGARQKIRANSLG